MLSVEELEPWDLWRVELWEQRVHKDVQDSLEWQLGQVVERKWQGNWMPDEAEEHHNVVVESKSLVTNDKLLDVYEGLDPPALFLRIKGIEECAESNCWVISWIVSGLNVYGVDDGVGHDGSQVHYIDIWDNEKDKAMPQVALGGKGDIEVDQLEGKQYPQYAT